MLLYMPLLSERSTRHSLAPQQMSAPFLPAQRLLSVLLCVCRPAAGAEQPLARGLALLCMMCRAWCAWCRCFVLVAHSTCPAFTLYGSGEHRANEKPVGACYCSRPQHVETVWRDAWTVVHVTGWVVCAQCNVWWPHGRAAMSVRSSRERVVAAFALQHWFGGGVVSTVVLLLRALQGSSGQQQRRVCHKPLALFFQTG
jgi:hypothetical protein